MRFDAPIWYFPKNVNVIIVYRNLNSKLTVRIMYKLPSYRFLFPYDCYRSDRERRNAARPEPCRTLKHIRYIFWHGAGFLWRYLRGARRCKPFSALFIVTVILLLFQEENHAGDQAAESECAETDKELMTDMGLISIREDAKDYYDKEKKKHKNYLNRQFHVSRPNEVWVSDITFFRYNEKSFYICVIIDLYARKVIAYKIGYNNSTQLTKSTFKSAYESRQPNQSLLFHTDNGSNYKSRSFMTYLKGLGVTQSFSRPHVPYDNSVMESFFSNMKREELYRTKYRSEKELRAAVDAYIKFYNGERPHSKNQYKTPDRKEAEYYSK